MNDKILNCFEHDNQRTEFCRLLTENTRSCVNPVSWKCVVLQEFIQRVQCETQR